MGRRLFKELERSYGFDDVAIVPGEVTINPDMTSTKMTIGDQTFDIPVLASAMDGAVSPSFATLMHEMGGLGVYNDEGLYTRYEDKDDDDSAENLTKENARLVQAKEFAHKVLPS